VLAHGESNNFPLISPLSWLRYRFHEHERCLFILWNTCCGCLRIHLIFRLTEKHYSLMLPFLYKENMTVQLQSMWDFTKWKQHMLAISCLNWKEEIEFLQVSVFPSCWWPLSSRLVVEKGRTFLIIPFLVSSAGLFEVPCFCSCKSNSVFDCRKTWLDKSCDHALTIAILSGTNPKSWQSEAIVLLFFYFNRMCNIHIYEETDVFCHYRWKLVLHTIKFTFIEKVRETEREGDGYICWPCDGNHQ
jgi:hypothetical protein